MNTRDQILQTLRANTRATILPPPWRSDRHFDDPAGRFAEAITKVKGYVHRARTMGDALNQLSALFADLNTHSVVYNDESPLDEVAWTERFPEIQFCSPQQMPDRQAWRALCATADVGITSADAFLAETGSLVISSGPGKSRMVSLLPPVHVAIVPMNRLTMDIFTWKEAHSRQFPANTVLISGPSKTADIEQTMSVGVHGPKKLIVVLVGD
ncbi:MAG TPA: lactate utilization protein [Anaerolineales bacterium]|nr:lactate utilization protein [Anaerolineales bacterium]